MGAAVGLSLLLVTEPCRADTSLAADLEWATATAEEIDTGTGGALRLGQRLDAKLVVLTGELGGSYHSFSGGPAPRVYRGFAGARLAVGALIRPFVYAHGGVGRAAFDRYTPAPSAYPTSGHTGFTYDAGGGLALTLLPLLNVGVHAGYTSLLGGADVRDVNWVALGLDAELVF
jgi:hypothetical protein